MIIIIRPRPMILLSSLFHLKIKNLGLLIIRLVGPILATPFWIQTAMQRKSAKKCLNWRLTYAEKNIYSKFEIA